LPKNSAIHWEAFGVAETATYNSDSEQESLKCASAYNLQYLQPLFSFSYFPGAAGSGSIVASGTVEGNRCRSTGAVVSGAKVEIRKPLTGYQQATTTDTSGVFRFSNLPFNNYHIEITQQGICRRGPGCQRPLDRSCSVKVTLTVAELRKRYCRSDRGRYFENVPYAHSDVDVSTLNKLPTLSPASGLSDAIILLRPGLVRPDRLSVDREGTSARGLATDEDPLESRPPRAKKDDGVAQAEAGDSVGNLFSVETSTSLCA